MVPEALSTRTSFSEGASARAGRNETVAQNDKFIKIVHS